jgi:hypothetical protein
MGDGCLRGRRLGTLRQIKQRHRPRHDVVHEAERDFADGVPLALVPVLRADVMTKNHTPYGQASRDGEFEGLAFDLAGDGAEDGKADLLVVASVAENDGGAASGLGLLAASLRIEHQPTDGA